MTQTPEQNLSKILRDELEKRMNKNPKYSLRAFSRDLGITPPTLSRVLRSERGISRSNAIEVAKKLNFNSQETEYFVQLVESKHARAKKVREFAKEKLKSFNQIYQEVDPDQFKVISDWYHLSILSLLETVTGKTNPAWIAKRLGITKLQTIQALERLIAQGMVKFANERYEVTGLFFANTKGIPSAATRSYHSQMLEKAKTALELQTVAERDFSSLSLAINPDQIEDARKAIKIFRDDFETKFCNSSTQKKEVYQLGVQFFRISNPNTQDGEE